MAVHNQLGKQGEQYAVDYLLGKGYRILECNYRYARHEVDIIAIKDQVLVVFEVKTRSSTYFGNPQDFISDKQKKVIIQVINSYINKNTLDVEVQFDVIAIVKTSQGNFEIKHIEDAFNILDG